MDSEKWGKLNIKEENQPGNTAKNLKALALILVMKQFTIICEK